MTAEASCTRCGDFVCRLCGPVSPVALCQRCGVRSTVDWEERAEQGLLRAFGATCLASLRKPVRLGGRLGGSGHLGPALQYMALCALSGLLPLALALVVPVLGFAEVTRFGIRSTGLLGTAASLLPLALVLSTLLPLLGLLASRWIWLCARACGARVRYDVVLRGFAYGLSPLAIPLLGPLLFPFALGLSTTVLYGVLRVRAGSRRALTTLVLAWGGVMALAICAAACSASALL